MLRTARLSSAATSFYMPNVTFIGSGALKMASSKIKSMNLVRPFIVTDEGISQSGLLEPTIELLKAEAGAKEVTVFSGVKPNPTIQNVNDGLKMLKDAKSDYIISIGGGSPQDCAKGIALVMTNGGKIEDLEGLDKATKPQFPLVAINTTAGTASELTRFAVITNESNHSKMVITTDMSTPLIAVNPTELMMKQPKSLTAATGMDALTHAVEAYVSVAASPITDACALQAIRLISKHLVKATFQGDNIEARDGMCYAEYLAGMAFNSAGLGYVHACAHQMGGMYDLPHGVCNAILLPHVEEFNKAVVPHRLRDIAEALGKSTLGMSDMCAADAALDAIRTLSQTVEIPSGFAALGAANEKDLPKLAEAAMKDVCACFNPRPATKEDVMQIFRNAF